MDKHKLLEQVRSVARLRHLSLRTEQAYADWIRRFSYQRGNHFSHGIIPLTAVKRTLPDVR